MSQPNINSPTTGKLPLPVVGKTTALSFLLSAAHGGVSLELPHPLNSWRLYHRFLAFFWFEVGQVQALQACGVQPNTSILS